MGLLLTYQFDWSVIGPILPLLLLGLQLTLEITVVVILIGMLAGIPVALARMSPVPLIRWPAQLYIEVFRGTPALVQLIWIYYALPALTGVALSPFVSVVIALGLNMAAYMAETYRAGFQAVPREHIEAAQVLGLSKFDTLRYITIPQAIVQQIPVILSMNIDLFKATSLVSVLGVADLTYVGHVQSSNTFRPLEIFTTIAALYFAIAFPAALLASALERRILLLAKSDEVSLQRRNRWAQLLLPGRPSIRV
jgi:polar amino acid transport system permease protein